MIGKEWQRNNKNTPEVMYSIFKRACMGMQLPCRISHMHPLTTGQFLPPPPALAHSRPYPVNVYFSDESNFQFPAISVIFVISCPIEK